MTHLIQSALTMLRAGEWMPVTAARAHPSERSPRLARRLAVPARGALYVDPRLADLLWAGSIQRRWPHRIESWPLRRRALVRPGTRSELTKGRLSQPWAVLSNHRLR